ncbi:acyl-CoA dehydrogenase family protein [Arthrobacter sp. AL08]|uniref:acyl-CoA dehydrogenase family protein n=1 Tax=Micrococcaceae TaxID=1268 RepID=UPI00249A421C|nr:MULTISPECIES: acyl-CoA dehydrogenase family protein [Micrococcaceae]MDI3240370.1 acyl-CoA dehydrogenase family protein [Arthrobacter sp. AL05]MDI3276380.1 acyl-CoA dehydrogenase family protein [Arthrobacter sp. AL08]MDJ0353709.1 acyl-CoA dehydrogenase family protein [Pseudarthrobacter sp. PH31-O2]
MTVDTEQQTRLYGVCDYYDAESLLTAGERRVLGRLRTFLDEKARPLLADYWERGEFPDELAEPLIGLDLMEPAELRGPEGSPARGIYQGFRIFELARTDASLATFYTAQAGLFRTAIRVGASAEQQAEWMPKVIDFSLKGVFSLTEPESGSDIAGGLSTTARREGDTWILDGAKRWIGGAATADVLAVFARDVADGQVKAFLVEREAPGVTQEKIHGKTALRMMQNAHITLEGVRVPESMRLHNVESFRDVAAMLRAMRSDVAWIATGIAAGAFEAALRYVTERRQFGRTLGSFQLVQEKVARMLGNVTSALSLVVRLTEQQSNGIYRDQDSALAKMQTSLLMRETVALAREVVGGNGITLETDVARFHADAEAVYSYEGTHEINALIVGRALTGESAFTR